MKSYELEEELRLNGLSVFTPKDVARLTLKPINYIYLLLHKSKRFIRIEKGLYCLNGTDPLAVASYIATPSYISLISAFSYYKLIDQVPRVIKVVTSKRHKQLEVMGTLIEFKSVKRSMLYGYRREHGIAIAEIEKAVVDSLYLLEDTQYLDEAVSNAISSNSFDKSKLLDYAKSTGKSTVYKRAKSLVKI